MTTTILLGAVLLQWIVMVAISFFKRIPKSLIASSLILAAGYINAFAVRRQSAVLNAAALPQRSETGSCALIEPGMSAQAVATKLGKPSDVRDDGKIRGPGAVTWVYRDSRCAIHLLDEKVELVE